MLFCLSIPLSPFTSIDPKNLVVNVSENAALSMAGFSTIADDWSNGLSLLENNKTILEYDPPDRKLSNVLQHQILNEMMSNAPPSALKIPFLPTHSNL